MGVLAPQRNGVFLLSCGHTIAHTTVDLILFDPVPQRRGVDPQLAGNLRDRLPRTRDNLHRITSEFVTGLPSRALRRARSVFLFLLLVQLGSRPGDSPPIIGVSGSRGERAR